ncbi:hypothetical protein P8452_51961 [Trifolium repens]|nr:hypothetical protein P8452_51961 [Trifolium repens]
MSSKRSRDSISHSRLAPSLDNKVGLHNLLVFRVAAAEHISQLLLEAVTFSSVSLIEAFNHIFAKSVILAHKMGPAIAVTANCAMYLGLNCTSKRKLGGRGIVSCYQGLLLCPVYHDSITFARRLCCSCMIATSPCDL